jgi:hypothetical protein
MQLDDEAKEWMKKRRGTKAPSNTSFISTDKMKKSILRHFYILYFLLIVSTVACVYYRHFFSCQ